MPLLPRLSGFVERSLRHVLLSQHASFVEATLESTPRVRLRTLDGIPLCYQSSLEFVLHWSFAVYQPYRPHLRGLVPDAPQPGCQLGSVGVRAVPVDDLDTCMEGDILAK